ncbi:MAG TPA: LacI family transcriptional regulator, partial [Candidatus Agrococcus pullicola]|nr:LacI family transcriptional regulator [Candidatus Agrococcus pullicola]
MALRAGVSTMTVSRALHGNDHVTEETRERVLAAVRELGYSRNENARSLRPGHSSNLIGVTVTDISNPYYGEFVIGVEEVLARHDKRVILGNTAENQEREERLLVDFAGRQADGAIIVPAAGTQHAHLRAMADRGMRMV